MEMKDAIKEWKSGKFRPVYVLYGKDRYRMRQFLETLISMLLPEDERELGTVKFDTSETAIEEAMAEADTLPFFASRKLVTHSRSIGISSRSRKRIQDRPSNGPVSRLFAAALREQCCRLPGDGGQAG